MDKRQKDTNSFIFQAQKWFDVKKWNGQRLPNDERREGSLHEEMENNTCTKRI